MFGGQVWSPSSVTHPHSLGGGAGARGGEWEPRRTWRGNGLQFRRIHEPGVPEASAEVCSQEEGRGQLCPMLLRRSRWPGEDGVLTVG